MKAYKVRSLLYLSGFIIAAVVYYHIEQQQKFQNTILNFQSADLHPEDTSSNEESKEMDNDLE